MRVSPQCITVCVRQKTGREQECGMPFPSVGMVGFDELQVLLAHSHLF